MSFAATKGFMGKCIAVILMLALLLPTVASAADLAGVSLDELYELRKAVSAEILSRSKWDSVTVPPGFYVVGEDIPAGHWTIKYTPKSYAIVMYFSKTDETGKNPDVLYGSYYQANIGAPGNDLETLYDMKEVDLELKEGFYLSIQFASVVFEPYTGRKSPFFD